MISLAITSMLLIAVAASFAAAAAAISDNDKFFRASQAVRVSMNQIQASLRRCQACQVYSDHIDLITDDGHDRTYKYFPAESALKLITNDILNDRDYIVARNVAVATFTADSAPDPMTKINRVVRVTMTFTVTVGKDTITLTGSSVPRRTLTY
jgi:hypothetical protein